MTPGSQTTNRAGGSIGDAFASLSTGAKELPPRFQRLKIELIRNNEEAILASWHRLLEKMATDTIPRIKTIGPKLIPTIDFSSIKSNTIPQTTKAELKESGVVIVRGVVSEKQALGWKKEAREYIAANPQTKGYPADNPQIYELYWTKASLEARSHPHMLAVQSALNQVWSSSSNNDVVDLSTPITYCDRLRIRTVSSNFPLSYMESNSYFSPEIDLSILVLI
jgi:hypothetical protein